jgi:Outer membrane protein beta-barrel domain
MYKLIALFLCLFTLSSFGQRNLFDIGIEGGFGSSSLRGNDFIARNYHNRTSCETGLFVQYNCRRIISIRTGMYYEQKGSVREIKVRDDVGSSIGTAEIKESFNYITIPILVRATIGNKVRYFVNAGPYLGFLLKQKVTYGAFQQFPEETFNATDNYKKTERGISTGAGILFNCKQRFAFSMELRNNLGLTNTSKLSVINNGEIKTSAVNLLLGVSYKPGHKNNSKTK